MIKRSVRNTVRAIYVHACGYCGLTETDAGAELTIDHFRPLDKDGTNDLDNLVYACAACNQFKSTAWSLIDSPVLHPLHEKIQSHMVERDDGMLEGLTDAGVRHIDTLHLNRPPLVLRRQNQQVLKTVLEQNADALVRLARLERSLDRLTRAVLKSVLEDKPRRM